MPWVGSRGGVLIKFVAVMNETHAARRLCRIDQLAFTHLHRQRQQKRNGESKVAVKRKGKAFKAHAMKAYRGEEVYLHSFLRSALGEGEKLTSHPASFTPGKEH